MFYLNIYLNILCTLLKLEVFISLKIVKSGTHNYVELIHGCWLFLPESLTSPSKKKLEKM